MVFIFEVDKGQCCAHQRKYEKQCSSEADDCLPDICGIKLCNCCIYVRPEAPSFCSILEIDYPQRVCERLDEFPCIAKDSKRDKCHNYINPEKHEHPADVFV